MRVVIAGAGSVGRSIARELIRNTHEVLLIDRDTSPSGSPRCPRPPGSGRRLRDSRRCDEAGIADCDVVVAATGDDKVNLVLSLLAKTEFAVPRTVARVNNPKNEWMFDEAWGVDVAVSTPRLMTALIEEAVSVGDLVRIFEFQQGRAMMVEITLPADSPYAGTRGSATSPSPRTRS
jgi:trk system potassium uptake protein TrkA